MNVRSFLVAAFSISFSLAIAPVHAGQDRALYPTNGPAQGGIARTIRIISGTAWAALEGGGLYKSADGGANWTASHTGIDHPYLRALQEKPGAVTTLYVVTEGGGGFYKTVDNGVTWNKSNSGLNCTVARALFVVTSGTNIGNLYVGTNCSGSSGVYKSTDDGATWTRVGFPTISDSSNIISFSGASDGTTIRANTASGVYVTNDNGVTWTLKNGSGGTALSGPNGQVVNTTTVVGSNWLAAVQGNGVFYSSNGGTDWFQASGLPANADGVGGFSVVGTDVWYGVDGAGIYKSTTSGVSWFLESGFSGLPHKRTRFFFREGVGPNYWALTLSGIYKSLDSGANWTKQSNGLPGGQINNVTRASDSAPIFVGGDTIYKSVDGGATYTVSDSGLGGILYANNRGNGGVLVHSSVPSTLFALTLNFGMYRSTDTGASWLPINNGLPSNLVGKGAGTFRIAPSDANTLYAQLGGGLYRTTNAGTDWSTISVPSTARSMAIDPTDPNIVYLSTNNGLYKTTNGGVSWLFRNPGNLTFGSGRPAVHGGSPNAVLLTVSATNSTDAALPYSGLYLSTDGAATWRQLVGNEKISFATFVQTPSGSTTIYVNTLGYLGESTLDESLFKCVDVFGGDFDLETNCRVVDLGPDRGFVRSLATSPERLNAIATTRGLAKHYFMFQGADFNNDSRADLFWRHSTSGSNVIWRMNGTGFLDGDSVSTIRTVTSPWVMAGFGDFDGNGTSDILWRNSSTGENYIYFMDSGIILPSEGYIRTVADLSWQVAGVGDFDGDGYSDILWRNASTGENYIYFMKGLNIVNEGYTRTVASSAWTVAAVGDFDGDSKADLLWRNTSTGENYLYFMDGLAILPSEGYIRTVTTAWTVKGLGDFNEDNRMDILWRNASTGENYVYPMLGLTILPTEGYLPTVNASGWDIAAIADFDGNSYVNIEGRGTADILWRNSTTGDAYLWSLSTQGNIINQCVPGTMSCTGFLPSVADTNWQIISK